MNIQLVRVETVLSPSWVSWREVEIMGAVITGVSSPETGRFAETFHLGQNYPNPFNPETTIVYQLPKATQVRLIIFNVRGQQVATLVDDVQTAGLYSVTWNGKDDLGRNAASGFYLYHLETKELAKVRKMVLIR